MILPTDIPTRAQLERLLAAREPSSVSIYLPTDPSSRGEAERIELKALAGEASTQLEQAGAARADVARAATLGLVDTVLVDIDEVVPGQVEEETGAVTFDDSGDAVNYGVVDEIARRVWLNGGKVFAVRRDDIPGNASVAAIFRYAP